jgi:hypothetical protein
MSDDEFRLECLRLAVSRLDPREAVPVAAEFYRFICREAPLSPANTVDNSPEPTPHQP